MKGYGIWPQSCCNYSVFKVVGNHLKQRSLETGSQYAKGRDASSAVRKSLSRGWEAARATGRSEIKREERVCVSQTFRLDCQLWN